MRTTGDGISVEFNLLQPQVLRRFWRGLILNMYHVIRAKDPERYGLLLRLSYAFPMRRKALNNCSTEYVSALNYLDVAFLLHLLIDSPQSPGESAILNESITAYIQLLLH